MNQSTTLLTQSLDCLAALLDSAYLDNSCMANDCLTAFDDFEWQPHNDLQPGEHARWEMLLGKGQAGQMGYSELLDFFKLTDPGGQVHDYFYRVQAQQLLAAISAK
ncbi:hypothetical protein [Shewanella marisflavi]|uniref:hypothetical protein n=1 Tax=Shewanella marisflavi TaxID=260364 RepID=UPI003AB00145